MAEKKGPRGAACRPKAVGWRAVATPRMTRRGFLGGGAAAPIALNSAFAANTDSDEARLEFDLSEDGSALNITESRNAQIVAQWHVEVASFGPHAWFELHAVSEPLGLRILKVRQAEFGGASQNRTPLHLHTETVGADVRQRARALSRGLEPEA